MWWKQNWKKLMIIETVIIKIILMKRSVTHVQDNYVWLWIIVSEYDGNYNDSHLVTMRGLRHCLNILIGRESLITGWKLRSLGYKSMGERVPRGGCESGG